MTEVEENFVFRIRNDTPDASIYVKIKYSKNGIVVGQGIGGSPMELDVGDVVDIDTLTVDFESADDFDCFEYTVEVFSIGDSYVDQCEFEGPNDC